MEQKKVLNDKSKLLVGNESELHYVRIDPVEEEYIKVWIKEPTYLQLEKAQMKLFNMNMGKQEVNLDMNEVYRYLWDAFVEKTEPVLTALDVVRLKPYVGRQIREILPDPFALLEGDADLKGQ
jgi:hypothetical protein